MPDRTQEIKNLRAVATACKNYTDERINDLEWQIGTYNYDVATDSNVARIKTFPSDTYKSQIDYIGGKSVKYNQLVELTNNTQSFTNNTDKTVTIQTNISFNANDKLVVLWYQNNTLTSNTRNTMQYTTISDGVSTYQSTSTNYNLTSGLKSWFIQPSGPFNLKYWASVLNTDLTISNIVVINLTQDFGAGNEPSTVETAIPLLKANGYKLDGTDTYSVGEFKNAITTSVNYLPINVWDEQWELGAINNNGQLVDSNNQIRSKNYIKVLPNTSYYFCNKDNTYTIYGFQYDANYNFIGTLNGINTTVTTSSNCAYLKFYVNGHNTYNNDICINISNANYNGNYYPYVAPITKAIPSEVLALELNKSAGSVYDVIDFNSKAGTRKVGTYTITGNEASIAVIGTNQDLIWVYFTNYASNNLEVKSGYTAIINDNINNNFTADEYMTDKTIALRGGTSRDRIYIKDSAFIGKDMSEIKTLISGIIIQYELATYVPYDLSQYFTDGWNKVDLDKQYATCEMVVDEPIDMPNSITNLIKEVKA